MLSNKKNDSSSYPQALFESPVLPRIANKTSLADAMWDIVKGSRSESVPASDVHYVIDVGALLHRLPWPRGKTSRLCVAPTIKDVTHLRRVGVVLDKLSTSLDKRPCA